MDGFSSQGFGLSQSEDEKNANNRSPQVSDYLNDAEENGNDDGVIETDHNPSVSNDEGKKKALIDQREIETWKSEEEVKKRKQNYMNQRIDISLQKYLGDETINEYVKRIEDLDRNAAENEAKIWAKELKEQLLPHFSGPGRSFNRDIVANEAENYFQINVPIIAKIIREIRVRDNQKMKNSPREIYLDFLQRFLRAYFNTELVQRFASVNRIVPSEAGEILEKLKMNLEEQFMGRFDSVTFNSFDEAEVFRTTEQAVLEELMKV